MITERHSVCPLDCPDTCSLAVSVENDRILAIKGSHANPYTAGVLCAKVPASYPGFVHGERRIRTPLRRHGARGATRFERISWDEALDMIHERFTAIIAAHGPQAILPLNYAGPHGFLSGGSMDLRFFHRLGASLLDRRPLCGGIRSEAGVGTFGAAPGMRPEQAEHARLIGAWGHDVPRADLHPMHVSTLAEWYATISPAAISVGNGLERNQNGGSGIRAVFALPALAGKFGVLGGGLVNGAGYAFPKTPGRLQRPDLVPAGTRTLNIVDVGAPLVHAAPAPPIKAGLIFHPNTG